MSQSVDTDRHAVTPNIDNNSTSAIPAHSDFVKGYRAGLIAAHVDTSLALKVMDSRLTMKRYRAAHTLWSWIWLLCLPAAVVCFIWVTWWAGAICLVLAVMLPGAIKQSAASFVLQQALRDPVFYDKCIEAGVIRLSARQ